MSASSSVSFLGGAPRARARFSANRFYVTAGTRSARSTTLPRAARFIDPLAPKPGLPVRNKWRQFPANLNTIADGGKRTARRRSIPRVSFCSPTRRPLVRSFDGFLSSSRLTQSGPQMHPTGYGVRVEAGISTELVSQSAGSVSRLRASRREREIGLSMIFCWVLPLSSIYSTRRPLQRISSTCSA